MVKGKKHKEKYNFLKISDDLINISKLTSNNVYVSFTIWVNIFTLKLVSELSFNEPH